MEFCFILVRKLNIELHFNWKDKQNLLGGDVYTNYYYFPELGNFTLFTHEE
jgi:hypothetical protein